MNSHPLFIGCDSAAVDLKNILVTMLRDRGYQVEDLSVAGADDDTAYAHVAERVCRRVLESKENRGILICGTGIGMAISANKVPGIRAAQIHDAFSAERAALSNDANIATLGARVIGPELAKKLVLEWLSHDFKPGPSSSKIEAIMDVESRYAGGRYQD